jgi:hypothetical protein
MPKRVLDFDALWGSDKLAACAEEAQAEYAWLYGLADASGCFELTNLRVIWGRVAAIRKNFSIERLEFVIAEFQDKGLLFVWEQDGKRYGHWTGSDVPGRLPAPSWRMRLEKFAPPVPKEKLAEYVARFSRGRAAMAAAGSGSYGRAAASGSAASLDRNDVRGRRSGEARFGGPQMTDERLLVMGEGPITCKTDSEVDSEVDSEIGPRLEEAQGQDWNGNWNLKRNGNWNAAGNAEGAGEVRATAAGAARPGAERKFTNPSFYDSKATANSKENALLRAQAARSPGSAENLRSCEREVPDKSYGRLPGEMADGTFDVRELVRPVIQAHAARDARSGFWRDRYRERELAAQREARVGQGPVCPPGSISAATLERIRKRDEERAAGRGK